MAEVRQGAAFERGHKQELGDDSAQTRGDQNGDFRKGAESGVRPRAREALRAQKR